MGGREGGGNLFTQGLARLVANVGTEITDAILDVSTRAGSHCRKKEDVPRPPPGPVVEQPGARHQARQAVTVPGLDTGLRVV